MSKVAVKKILDHPDRDDIIAKLVIGISPKDIYEWLCAKYTNVSEKKFILPENGIIKFKNEYLDIYKVIQEDLSSVKKSLSNGEELKEAIKKNSAYKNALVEAAGKEIDLRTMIQTLALNIEKRLAQVFDQIQEDPETLNTRVDRLLIDYASALGDILEKYYKFTEVQPTTVINNNTMNVQFFDQQISVFHDVIKEVLSEMDLEQSLIFMEIFNNKMLKVRQPLTVTENISIDDKLKDAKLLSETITNRLNQ